MSVETKKIAYEACFNLGNYEHEKIRFEAVCDPSSSLEETVELLRQKAIQAAQPKAGDLWSEVHSLKSEIKELSKLCQKWRDKWTATSDFLKTQGIRPDCPEMPMFLDVLSPSIETEKIQEAFDDQPF
jgi:hypothetical protein